MTDTLRDLLRESVADTDMPDVADVAWRSGARARRRQALTVVAGVATVALATGGTVWAVDQRSTGHGASPVHQPSSTAPGSPATPSVPGRVYDGSDGGRDGSYHGTSVWWSPRVAQEATLPAYPGNPLPSDIDVSQVGREIPSTLPPVGRGLAAFAVVGDAPEHVWSVGVLGADGVVRLVDTSRVQPVRDPEGNLRVRVGPSMLSPTGEYLMFPEQSSLLVLRLRDDHWSRIDTGSRATWDATWATGHAIMLADSARPGTLAPTYDVSGRRLSATRDWSSVFDGDAYGLARRSTSGSLAQAYVAGPDVPQPPALHLSPGQSDWIGIASGPDAILVLPQESERQKQCCQVATWLSRSILGYESRSGDGLRLLAWRMGSGRFWQVASVSGGLPGTSVVSSYADLGG